MGSDIPPPTIAAIIRHAGERPGAAAVVNNGVATTYADLARTIAGFAQALAALGLRPGQTAAVQCGDQYLHLLLLLAAERSGIATASFVSGELDRPLPLLAQVDLVLTELPARISGARRIHAITKPWVEATLALRSEAEEIAPQSLDAPVRFQRTSGTTGFPKRILMRRRVHEARQSLWAEIDRMVPGDRALIALPFTMGTSYSHASSALRAGATTVFDSRVELAEALTLHAITHIKMLPLQLRDLLERLPPDFVKPPRLVVATVGGRLAPHLRERLMTRLAVRLHEQYASNEMGLVSEMIGDGPGAIGSIYPGVAVEIVDADDKPVPHGQSGRVRVKAETVVEAYLDDPEATARMFRDGWFYPGDLGILHAPGRLEVIGREDDLLNIGGRKILPEELEDRIRERAAVGDVGVCALPNADGIDEVWVAVVYDAPDDRDIRIRLRPAFVDFIYGHAHLVKLAAVPRTATGKIKRADLRAAILAAGKSGR